jgi:ligand-binding sensor domain-containing protein/signal transduction histidine kinase
MHRWQRSTNSVDDWSDWENLGGHIASGFAVGRNVMGAVEFFGADAATGEVMRLWQSSPGSSDSWKPWEHFGANVKPGIGVAVCASGRLEIFAIDATNSAVLHRWENFNDGSDKWSVWASMGATGRPYPGVAQNEDGNEELFVADLDNPETIYHKRQISRASDWLDWSSLERATVEYSSRTWQTDEGLPDNVVQAIAHAADGYLWVGTRRGAAKFDGVTFTPFVPNDAPELRNTSITALCAEPRGPVWIGTDGAGLFRWDGKVLARFTRTNGLAGDELRVICRGQRGDLLIGTTTGMSHYVDGNFTNYTKADGLMSDVVRSIYQARDDSVWIATGAGLNRLRAGKMDFFPMPKGLPNDSVRGICQERGGRIWIGSNNGMLWYNVIWEKSFYAYNTRYGLSDSFVSAMCEDREGNLWVGTYSGLNRFREGRFFNELNNEGQPFDRVNALMEDREGNLWVGSKEGLARLTPKRFVTMTRRQGLTHNNVMSVLQDRAGSLWVATWGGGLNQLRDEKVTAYSFTNDFTRDLVLATCEARDGSIWMGADFEGGLTHLKNGEATRYTSKDGLFAAPVRVIHECRSGDLWIGTGHGLSRMRNGKFTNFSANQGLAGNVVRDICEDHNGILWIATDGGLSRWDDGKFVNFTKSEGLSDNVITALREDSEGNFWIGTATGGLNRFRDGKCTACTTRQGLFSDEIFEILDDDLGWLWMSCSKGVFRVRKADVERLDQGKTETVSSIAYGKTDGMESTACNGIAKPAGCKLHDGRLCFATSKGLVTVDPGTVRLNDVPPPVYIEQIFADRRRIQSDIHDTKLRIPPGRGELEIHFAALNLQAPEDTRFQYKLEGVDRDWVDAGWRRTANYAHVPAGEHQFRVMACNRDGVWNTEGATLEIELQPHIWQTWWFEAAVMIAAVVIVGGGSRYVTRRRMQRELERLEQQHAIEKERGRIAKDIHDDLGSSLTRIMMIGERAEEDLARREDVGMHVEKMVGSARHMVRALDEIVWAVNPENDSVEGLVEYISHYADEFFEDTNVRCRLEFPNSLPASILPAEVRHEVFLVVKEAFNNLLKHSGASEVRVLMNEAKSRIEISIEDNGCGFDPNCTGNGRKGNGLPNMRKRITTLGGQLAVESAPRKGTRIKVSIPLG